MHQAARPDHVVIVPPQKAREEDIPALAYKLWQARGCPEGSSQEDWFRAVAELESHH
ncbi:MAG: DUF2934 domain-containing protein [Terriglobia bacterium]